MKYGRRTLGHVEAVFNKLGGDEAVELILAGEARVEVTRISYTYLRPVRTVWVDGQSRRYSPRFRFGRRWDANFVRIINAARKTIWLPETEIGQFELIKGAAAPQIKGELPDGHAFDPSEFFPRLGYLLGHEESKLAEYGYANLFYVDNSVVGDFEVAVWFDERMGMHIVASLAHADLSNPRPLFKIWPEKTRVFSRSSI